MTALIVVAYGAAMAGLIALVRSSGQTPSTWRARRREAADRHEVAMEALAEHKAAQERKRVGA